MQEPLEQWVSSLSQVDAIREHISEALQLLSVEEHGISDQMHRLRSLHCQSKIKPMGSISRIQGLLTEMEDCMIRASL